MSDRLKRVLKAHILQTAVLYGVAYIVWTFIVWGFTNPLQWIMDVPTYSEDGRIGFILFWTFYTGASLGARLSPPGTLSRRPRPEDY